jgi:hypothetical protein
MSAGSFLVSDQKRRVSHPRVRHVLQGEAPKPSYVLLHFPRAVLRGVAEENPARSLRAETYRARYRFGAGVQRVAVFGVLKAGGADGPTAASVPRAFFVGVHAVPGHDPSGRRGGPLCGDGAGPRGYRGRTRGAAVRSNEEGGVRQPWEQLGTFQRTY